MSKVFEALEQQGIVAQEQNGTTRVINSQAGYTTSTTNEAPTQPINCKSRNCFACPKSLIENVVFAGAKLKRLP